MRSEPSAVVSVAASGSSTNAAAGRARNCAMPCGGSGSASARLGVVQAGAGEVALRAGGLVAVVVVLQALMEGVEHEQRSMTQRRGRSRARARAVERTLVLTRPLRRGRPALRARAAGRARLGLSYAREHLAEDAGEVAALLRGPERGHEGELQFGALAHEFGGADTGPFGLGIKGRP
jgi:hypothetical protein